MQLKNFRNQYEELVATLYAHHWYGDSIGLYDEVREPKLWQWDQHEKDDYLYCYEATVDDLIRYIHRIKNPDLVTEVFTGMTLLHEHRLDRAETSTQALRKTLEACAVAHRAHSHSLPTPDLS